MVWRLWGWIFFFPGGGGLSFSFGVSKHFFKWFLPELCGVGGKVSGGRWERDQRMPLFHVTWTFN